MQNPATVEYDTAAAEVTVAPDWFHPEPGVPFLYVLCDAENAGSPIYVGEYGRAKGYNAIERVRRHFLRANSSTMNRVRKNLTAFGITLPTVVIAHFFELTDEFRDNALRESLEAWVICDVCHVNRTHDQRFCVTKFRAPCGNYQFQARSISALVAARA